MTADRPTGPPCGNNPNHKLSDGDRAAVEQFQAYLVTRAEQRATETDEERADREETKRDHAAGDHKYCGVTCEAEFTTEKLRNSILVRAIPGSKSMLDELLRRARAEAAAAPALAVLPDRLSAVLTERFTALGNPFSEMRLHEKGPDGWPASHPLGPNDVAEVLRELLSTDEAQQTEVDVDTLARLIHDADVYVNHGDYPKWDDLSTTPGLGQDEVRKAARWLMKRLHITARTEGQQS